jgi:hypothetical protein
MNFYCRSLIQSLVENGYTGKVLRYCDDNIKTIPEFGINTNTGLMSGIVLDDDCTPIQCPSTTQALQILCRTKIDSERASEYINAGIVTPYIRNGKAGPQQVVILETGIYIYIHASLAFIIIDIV